MAYVGTFSSPLPIIRPGQVDLPPGNGRGIHIFEVNRKTGALMLAGIFELPTSPDCLAVNASGTRLYSTNETEKLPGNDAGSISSFSIDRVTGQLKLINTVSSGGAGPTYLSIHPSGKFLLVANYFGGSVSVIPVHQDGSLAEATDVKKDEGTVGPKHATNAPKGSFAVSGHDLPHAHMIKSDASGKFVISTDLGLDQIRVWKFDARAGVLAPNDFGIVPLPSGDGPRHFSFHPNGRWFYCLQEEASTIALFDYDSSSGKLTRRESVSSLPPGFAGSSFSSELLVSADGKFVYAGNRLHDGIACFAIGKNGSLKFVAEEWTRGDYPRSFNFDPSGNFLYSCNQRGDAVTCFKLNKQTGRPTFTGQYTPVGNPSMIEFVDLARS